MLRLRLRRLGVPVVGRVAIDDFLRKRRIRARATLSREVALELAQQTEARYLMLGTIDTWSIDNGPEVGLTARLLEPGTGRTIWAGRGGAVLHN